ncbi:hypothetical protein KJ641_01415, partial [Patescibacteria group bacterium]|nr:hypothetical protein [Patescibacteria group bacterium]
EKIKNSDLLDALLISSLNTPARMLVSNISDGEDAFITKMNNQVIGWGLVKTKFVEPAGTSLENVSTAREYLTIFVNSTKNVIMQEHMSKPSYEYTEILDLNNDPDHSDIHSNKLARTTHNNYTIIASKTGYLDEAGSGLTMWIERNSDHKQFVLVTMGNPDYEHRFDDPEALLEWTLDKF